MTPAEIAAMAASSITLITFATLGNIFKDKDENLYKRYLAIAWPYFRGVLKGIKNAYKGLNSTLKVVELLGIADARNLVVPVGLLLGVLAAFSRMGNYYFSRERKMAMDANDVFLKEFKKAYEKIFTERNIELEDIYKKISTKRGEIKNRQAQNSLKKIAFINVLYGSFIDGLYLYVGVLSLCALAPPALVAMSVFCGIYFLACIATRIYEEYIYQRELAFSDAKIDLALIFY
jgi:hypothetical protein